MFIAMNTVFISKSMFIPMIITGFFISIIWTLNVKKVAFGEWVDRVVYALGASVGTAAGFIVANFIREIT
jgi:Na+-translocating ferredoxin:NAD+ oxidoreductase RnfA subunit